MPTETTHPAQWQPRDENGQFTGQDMQRCRECDGSGVVEYADVGDYDHDGPPEPEDWITREHECERCDGRGSEYKPTGCPRCGADDLDSSLMPSSSYKQQCSECGWWELVG